MLTDLQTKKLNHFFNLMDFDHNGMVEKVDFEGVAVALAKGRGLGADAEETKQIVAGHVMFWAGLAEAVDADRDGKISRPEWLAFCDKILATPALYQETMGRLSAFVVATLDADGDGFVTSAEYKAFLTAYKVPATTHDESLKHIDPKQSGRLTTTEAVNLTSDFFVGSDPKAAGNWLFGPIA